MKHHCSVILTLILIYNHESIGGPLAQRSFPNFLATSSLDKEDSRNWPNIKYSDNHREIEDTFYPSLNFQEFVGPIEDVSKAFFESSNVPFAINLANSDTSTEEKFEPATSYDPNKEEVEIENPISKSNGDTIVLKMMAALKELQKEEEEKEVKDIKTNNDEIYQQNMMAIFFSQPHANEDFHESEPLQETLTTEQEKTAEDSAAVDTIEAMELALKSLEILNDPQKPTEINESVIKKGKEMLKVLLDKDLQKDNDHAKETSQTESVSAASFFILK